MIQKVNNNKKTIQQNKQPKLLTKFLIMGMPKIKIRFKMIYKIHKISMRPQLSNNLNKICKSFNHNKKKMNKVQIIKKINKIKKIKKIKVVKRIKKLKIENKISEEYN